MRIQITAEDIDIKSSDRESIQTKIVDKIDRLLEDFAEDVKTATIKIEKIPKKDIYKVNFDMWLPGKKHIYADEEHQVFESALVQLSEDISDQVKEYKDRITPS